MEKFSISYKGSEYSALSISLDKVSDIDSSELVIIADCSLWDAIEVDYENGIRDGVMIDNDVYFYCDYGVIDSFKSDLDVINYFENNV